MSYTLETILCKYLTVYGHRLYCQIFPNVDVLSIFCILGFHKRITMKSYFILSGGSTLYCIYIFLDFLLWGRGSGVFFMPLFFLMILPLWFYGITYIKHTVARDQAYLSIPQVLLFALLSFLSVHFLELTPLSTLALVSICASTILLIYPQVLYLIGTILLLSVALESFFWDYLLINTLTKITYNIFLAGFLLELLLPSIRWVFDKITFLKYSPIEWQHYLIEIQGIFRGFLKFGAYIFLVVFVYVQLQQNSWYITLSPQLPTIIVIVFYFSFLIVPVQWRLRQFRSLKI